MLAFPLRLPVDLDVWRAALHRPLLQSGTHLQEEETLRFPRGTGHHGPQFLEASTRLDGRVQGTAYASTPPAGDQLLAERPARLSL